MVNDVITVIKPTHNWKSHGLDKLQNFWIKWFSVLHKDLNRDINDTIIKTQKISLRG
jgi:hypothetical protein